MNKSNKVRSFFNKLFKIDPNIPLHKNIIFWLPIVFFVTPALMLSFPTWCFCWPNPEAYEAILATQAFPVFIASLAIPFTVAINRFHSSSQRAESNRLAQQNMTFNQYFEHRSHFYKHVETMLLREPFRNFIHISQPDKLYEIVFPLNKVDHQDMSAPNKLVTERISKCVDSVFEFINPCVIDLANGKELFKKESAATFVAKIGEPFGIIFNEKIIKYVDKTGNKDVKSTLDLCFFSLLEVVQKAGQFSHKNFGGWTPALALDPLLKSTNDNKELNQFIIYLERCLIFSSPDEEQD